jgi:hypothetical protein
MSGGLNRVLENQRIYNDIRAKKKIIIFSVFLNELSASESLRLFQGKKVIFP